MIERMISCCILMTVLIQCAGIRRTPGSRGALVPLVDDPTKPEATIKEANEDISPNMTPDAELQLFPDGNFDFDIEKLKSADQFDKLFEELEAAKQNIQTLEVKIEEREIDNEKLKLEVIKLKEDVKAASCSASKSLSSSCDGLIPLCNFSTADNFLNVATPEHVEDNLATGIMSTAAGTNYCLVDMKVFAIKFPCNCSEKSSQMPQPETSTAISTPCDSVLTDDAVPRSDMEYVRRMLDAANEKLAAAEKNASSLAFKARRASNEHNIARLSLEQVELESEQQVQEHRAKVEQLQGEISALRATVRKFELQLVAANVQGASNSAPARSLDSSSGRESARKAALLNGAREHCHGAPPRSISSQIEDPERPCDTSTCIGYYLASLFDASWLTWLANTVIRISTSVLKSAWLLLCYAGNAYLVYLHPLLWRFVSFQFDLLVRAFYRGWDLSVDLLLPCMHKYFVVPLGGFYQQRIAAPLLESIHPFYEQYLQESVNKAYESCLDWYLDHLEIPFEQYIWDPIDWAVGRMHYVAYFATMLLMDDNIPLQLSLLLDRYGGPVLDWATDGLESIVMLPLLQDSFGGEHAEKVVYTVIAMVGLIILYRLRRVMLGIAAAALVVILLPSLLVIYAAARVISLLIFRKATRKKAGGKKSHHHHHHHHDRHQRKSSARKNGTSASSEGMRRSESGESMGRRKKSIANGSLEGRSKSNGLRERGGRSIPFEASGVGDEILGTTDLEPNGSRFDLVEQSSMSPGRMGVDSSNVQHPQHSFGPPEVGDYGYGGYNDDQRAGLDVSTRFNSVA